MKKNKNLSSNLAKFEQACSHFFREYKNTNVSFFHNDPLMQSRIKVSIYSNKNTICVCP